MWLETGGLLLVLLIASIVLTKPEPDKFALLGDLLKELMSNKEGG